eukprot:TRINITY_DN64125_c0_g1_i2.p1 TRINITY_DN64125_c0_g1~~TRINITY_DN64125_c0_g1_i2.p1  ORF type:complete len:159 (-),score=24.93 TRINITY_DN64125_c0_g1_i2:246-722(-)
MGNGHSDNNSFSADVRAYSHSGLSGIPDFHFPSSLPSSLENSGVSSYQWESLMNQANAIVQSHGEVPYFSTSRRQAHLGQIASDLNSQILPQLSSLLPPGTSLSGFHYENTSHRRYKALDNLTLNIEGSSAGGAGFNGNFNVGGFYVQQPQQYGSPYY